MNAYQKILVFVFAILGALSLASVDVSAYTHYGGYPYYGGSPIYTTGYHSYAYSYGWSGWGYNRVYYQYHRPYYYASPYSRPYVSYSYRPYVTYPYYGRYWASPAPFLYNTYWNAYPYSAGFYW